MLILMLDLTLVATRSREEGKDGHDIDLLNLLGELPGGGKDQGLALPQASVNLLEDCD